MTKTLEAFEKNESIIKDLTELIDRWYLEEVRLTGAEYLVFTKELEASKANRQNLCPHDQASIYSAKWHEPNKDFSQRYFTQHDIKCERCEKMLVRRTNADDRKKIFGPVPAKEAVKEYLKYENVTEEELKELGLTRKKIVIETIE